MTRKSAATLVAVVAVLLLALAAATTIKRFVSIYMYGYPIVLMDRTRGVMLEGSPQQNQLIHSQIFPDHTFRNVVRPNIDTLYSFAWLDLGGEALVLSVPDAGERYYVMPFMDAWTNVYDSVGKRKTGTGEGDYLIAGPGWQGEIPMGLDGVIRSPTEMSWLIGRIQANGPRDVERVAALQQQFALRTLSDWKAGRTVEAIRIRSPEDQGQDDPARQVAAMDVVTFLGELSRLLQHNPPGPQDGDMLDTLAAVGVKRGSEFDGDSVGLWSRELGNLAFSMTRKTFKVMLSARRGLENGWMIKREGIGRYGADYPMRMAIAMIGLGALPPEEAIYPNAEEDSEGRPLTGQHRYRLHFAPGECPPSDAFWSLTLYDDEGFLVENTPGRYAIGDRDALTPNDDGSLDVLVQQHPPEDATANWLPAPAGAFALTLRVYLPRQRALQGDWRLPGVERLPR